MKLLSCHIENFGTLHDFTLELKEGVNVICRENGFGKSTLAAFFRAMFYGFEGEKKRSLEENERKRYKPWQGGPYGGQLIFSVGEKTYCMSRLFGEKESEDEFELRDTATNAISNDYTTRIGEELFQIDRESFTRTLFIGQNGCDTESTDDINAKIGNLTDNTNDLNNFETATKALTEWINRLTPKRATGSLSRQKDEIASLERQVLEIRTLNESLEKVSGQRKTQRQIIAEATQQQQTYRNLQSRVSREQALLEQKKQWQRLVLEVKESKERVTSIRQQFPGEVPGTSALQEAINGLDNLEWLQENMDRNPYSEEDMAYLGELRRTFQGEAPNPEEIREMREKVTRLRTQKEAFREKQAGKALALLLVAMVILMAGVLSFFFSAVLAVGLLVAGGMLLLWSVLGKKKTDPDILAGEQEIEDYLEQMGMEASREHWEETLYRLEKKAGDYLELTKRSQMAKQAKNRYLEAKEKWDGFFATYQLSPGKNPQDTLKRIGELLEAYSSENYLLSAREEALECFEKETDRKALEELNPENEQLSPEEIETRLKALDTSLEEARKNRDMADRQLEDLSQRLEELEEKQELLLQKKAQYETELQKYHRIVKARDYLATAKENMTSRYSGPILQSFQKYYQGITGDSKTTFHLDAKTVLTMDAMGRQRGTETLSAGCRDLVGICLRVALVEAMYTRETPILIMDDPFTNLDDERLATAKEMLQKIGETYQVLYFTCSEARKG